MHIYIYDQNRRISINPDVMSALQGARVRAGAAAGPAVGRRRVRIAKTSIGG